MAWVVFVFLPDLQVKRREGLQSKILKMNLGQFAGVMLGFLITLGIVILVVVVRKHRRKNPNLKIGLSKRRFP